MSNAAARPLVVCPSSAAMDDLIRAALAEDVGPGDVTTNATIAPAAECAAKIVARAPGVVAGLPIAAHVFQLLEPGIEFEAAVDDGARIAPGDVLARLRGRTAAILTGERVALNFLQHLSGIATETARLVGILDGLPTRLVDTRKTVPGLRTLAKYAVRTGGGHNHRLGLYDAVLIKDNHIAAVGSVPAAVERARAAAPHTTRIEVEADTLAQVVQALEAGADIVLLDNMDVATMRHAVELCRGRALTEASGGITADRLRAVAETGVDLISVGALTHSVCALDVALEIESVKRKT